MMLWMGAGSIGPIQYSIVYFAHSFSNYIYIPFIIGFCVRWGHSGFWMNHTATTTTTSKKWEGNDMFLMSSSYSMLECFWWICVVARTTTRSDPEIKVRTKTCEACPVDSVFDDCIFTKTSTLMQCISAKHYIYRSALNRGRWQPSSHTHTAIRKLYVFNAHRPSVMKAHLPQIFLSFAESTKCDVQLIAHHPLAVTY